MDAKDFRVSRRLYFRRLFSWSAGLFVCLATGCGGPKVFPVSGTATLDGKPLAGFLLTFTPDVTKGHDGRMDCAGRIGSEGKYSLRMDDGFKQYQGIPLGWYKVTMSSPDDVPLPVHKKFTSIKTTPLSIEVVANPQPGAYDLQFTK